MAEWTGLEPATPGVTGRYSNQLNYHSAVVLNFKPLLRTAPGINCLPDPASAFTEVYLVRPRGFEPL